MSSSVQVSHFYFNRLPRLWNSLPPINLKCLLTVSNSSSQWTGTLANYHNNWVSHPTFCVYNSLYSSVKQKQINTTESEISLHFIDVPVQAGTCDVWYCTCNGYASRRVSVQSTRNETTSLAVLGKMEMFPFIRRRRSRK